jgi:hypothetical protein
MQQQGLSFTEPCGCGMPSLYSLGAAIGCISLLVPHIAVFVLEGIAVGASLTMLAETMLLGLF